MLINVSFTLANRLLSRYLNQQEGFMQGLHPYANQVIKIEVADTHFTFFIRIEQQQLTLLQHYTGPIAVTVTGTSHSLIQSLTTKATMPSLTIHGDTALLQALQQSFTNYPFDGEELLSHYLGDILAHQLGNHFRFLKKFLQQKKISLEENLVEYLQEEQPSLITPTEWESLNAEISILRNDVERLKARIARL